MLMNDFLFLLSISLCVQLTWRETEIESRKLQSHNYIFECSQSSSAQFLFFCGDILWVKLHPAHKFQYDTSVMIDDCYFHSCR